MQSPTTLPGGETLCTRRHVLVAAGATQAKSVLAHRVPPIYLVRSNGAIRALCCASCNFFCCERLARFDLFFLISFLVTLCS
jgi:hypothetical protein